MTLTLSSLILPTFAQQLRALSGQLDKGIAHAGDGADALMQTRLAPDMHPLGTQIKFSCAQVADPVARLLGQPITVTPDVETAAQAKALIGATLERLRAADAASIDANSDTVIHLDLPNGMAFDLTGADYARDWALPQFYFHVSIAYALLRQAGAPIGKADLVPHMMAHFRRPAAQ